MRGPSPVTFASRTLRQLAQLLPVGLAILPACGSDSASSSASSPTGNSNTQATQSAGNGGQAASTVINLPVALTSLPTAWDESGSTLDPTLMNVQVGDPAPVFTDTTGKAQVQWTNTTAVSADSCSTDAQGIRTCLLTISNIETKDYSIGMLVKVGETRTSYSGTGWTSLSTGVAQATLTALRGTTSGVSPSPVFTMTSDGGNQLSKWSGIAKVDLVENGAMLGLMLDKNKKPVQGAQLTTNDSSLQVVYANNTFDGPGTPGPSATLPYFIVTPQTAKVVKSSGWTIAAPAPATAKWTVPLVGSAPNYLVMIPFVAQ